MTDETTDELEGVANLAWSTRRRRALRIDADESTESWVTPEECEFSLASLGRGIGRSDSAGVSYPTGNAYRLSFSAGRSHMGSDPVAVEVISK
ncbi:hypothetical protein [Halocatena salina]|uniref:Uncharacterized protein n=1 Tax=Halocatena salina TaxID=2934340 RepID=A0A8U0A2T5_9EURY|nr:hypothetical protein [Halocatena salina]UPM42313.1 hypothetical protein MW046_10125 [Halocatena salina]